MVVPITCTLRLTPTHARFEQNEGGLKNTSMAKCEQLTTLDKELLIRGPFAEKIRETAMEAVERAIMRAIGIVI